MLLRVADLEITNPFLNTHQIGNHVPKKRRSTSDILKRTFRLDSRKKGVIRSKYSDRTLYIIISAIFAVVLAVVFDNNIRALYNRGGDLPTVVDGMFSLLMTLTFAIIGVYLVVHVLHPNFGKKSVPASIKKVTEDNKIAEDMSREELIEFIKDLESSDEEVKAYMNTIGVKADVATTLGAALLAFFFGMYAYITSYTIGYEGSPNILPISLCFTYIIFANVYMILKTMKVIWDV